ncbi:MAG: acylneuraminate cytidylyltransferase family protein [Hymenobacteraceae bacterium]|nr:acylneuraminate cytidylyltransferase family protein [Hymenobacteraceae bacterium]
MTLHSPLPVLAIIPARGGSKGIIRKNLRELLGKPLLQYPIDTARQSRYIDRIVVSTDDAEIGALAEQLGVEVVWRPAEMATDSALVIDAIRYTIAYLRERGYDPAVVTLLEATSPARRVADLDRAIEAVLSGQADTAASFHETEVSPNRLWKVDEAAAAAVPYLEGAQPFLPRQQQPKAYQLNGQLYAFSPAVLAANPQAITIILGRVCPIVTPRELAVDIDEEFDLLVAEQVLRRHLPAGAAAADVPPTP